MFIQTEATPNPATLKFLPGKIVIPEGTQDFRNKQDAENRSPLAVQLFEIEGVTGVFFGHDFITITKNEVEWSHIKPAILGTIMEHFVAGLPVMASNNDAGAPSSDTGEFYDKADEHIVITIKELLETRIRPAVAQDGGDITFKGFRDGTVFLTMKGACAGCPSSTATLKHGIQNLLRHFVPEVLTVESV